MIRKIIKIDKEKCNGCGLCVAACHEGAIGMVDGKARLMRDDYCDGLGDCLPSCPTGAITFENREALAYNEEEVKRNMQAKKEQQAAQAFTPAKSPCGCPGTHAKAISRSFKTPNENACQNGQQAEKQNAQIQADISKKLPCGCPGTHAKAISRSSCLVNADNFNTLAADLDNPNTVNKASFIPQSRLNQWPVQIKLVPVNAVYFSGAHLLVSADCAAYAYGNFHAEFIKNKITLIGCPKLDSIDYAEKLTAILQSNDIKSVTAVRMEVPCCGGIEQSVKRAIAECGKAIPWRVVTISTSGEILDDTF